MVDSKDAVLGAGGLVAFEAELAASAGEIAMDEDALAFRDGRDPGTQDHHLPGDVVTGNERQPCAVRMPGVFADPDVEAVHRARRDLHHHLARGGQWVGPLNQLKDLGAAVLGHHDRAHQ